MKWHGKRQSDNTEDRRGKGSSVKLIAGGGIIGVIILLINMFGSSELQNLTPVLEQLNQGNETTTERALTPKEVEGHKMMGVLLADNDDFWSKIFQKNGMTYVNSGTVLFSSTVQAGYGNTSAAKGSFYCLADQKIYLDLAFFDELKTKLGAKGGDFSIAYVLAHELGHHVQTLLGTSSKVRKMQEGTCEKQAK
jgi:predicted metalloprotease